MMKRTGKFLKRFKRSSTIPPPPQRLCTRCRSIDFDSILAHQQANNNDAISTGVTLVRDELFATASSCDFCQLLSAVFPRDADVSQVLADLRGPVDGWTYRLYTIPVREVFPIIRESPLNIDHSLLSQVGLAILPHVPGDPSVIQIVYPVGFVWWTVAAKVMNSTGYITIVDTDECPQGTVRLITVDHFDFSWAETLVQICRDRHPSCSSLSLPLRSPSIDGLRLIDCRSRTLVEAEAVNYPPYLILSYVWGSLPAPTASSSIDLSDALPRTIEDSITVTTKLGFQYLWIDKYCIPQNDPVRKSEQISLMGTIYNSAEATIIAAAGNTPEYGLPGVSRGRFQSQHAIHLKKFSLANSLRNPERPIFHSEWATRGWTHQEGILSRRRIVFTDEQAYFQCDMMFSHETMSGVVPMARAYETDIFKMVFPVDLANLTAWSFLSQVGDYSKRKFTVQSDIIDAFRGILQIFGAQGALRSIWGIPIFPRPTRAMPARIFWKDGPNTPWETAQSGLHHGFIGGLCWHLGTDRYGDRGHLRRLGFPSWSWLGWQAPIGEIEAWNSECFVWDPFSPSPSLHLPTGELIELEQAIESWPAGSIGTHLQPVLTLDCYVLPVEREGKDWFGVGGGRRFSTTPQFFCSDDSISAHTLAVRMGHIWSRPQSYDRSGGDPQVAAFNWSNRFEEMNGRIAPPRLPVSPPFIEYLGTFYIILAETQGGWERVGQIFSRGTDPFSDKTCNSPDDLVSFKRRPERRKPACFSLIVFIFHLKGVSLP
jgi:hypothetical protein